MPLWPNDGADRKKTGLGVPIGAQLSPVVIVCHQVAANKKRTITIAKEHVETGDEAMHKGEQGMCWGSQNAARFGTLQELNEWNEELVCCGCCQCSFIVTFLLGGRLKAATTLLLSD